MPQTVPSKRQFTTIDGRTVMSNLPQHWGGNDWKVTGVDNPLPVGNYVQTEAGVWIPQKGSDDGAADVRLTGRKVQVKQIIINSSEQVDTGSSSEMIIMPTSGYKAKIVSLFLNVAPPAGATTGNHMFFVYFDLDYIHRLLRIMGDYDIRLLFRGDGASIGSGVTTVPSDLNAVINNIKG